MASRSDGTTTVTFTYRGLTDAVVQERDSSNNTWSFAFDSRGHRLAVKLPNAAKYAVLTNPHGDIVGLAQVVGGVGVVQGWTHYDAWGKVLASGGTQIPYAFGFQGSYMDPLGFVLMGARWYYPALGRFLSSDPASVGADTRSPINRERWIYGDNSPLRYSDPSGLYPICDVDENGHPVRCPKDVPADDIQKKDTTTTSPTRTRSESPKANTGRLLASIFNTARSLGGSVPTTLASRVRSSFKSTLICSAPSITWWFVRM